MNNRFMSGGDTSIEVPLRFPRFFTVVVRSGCVRVDDRHDR